MNRKELAKHLGISAPYLSLIYHGRRRPSWAMAQKLKAVCRRTYEWWKSAPQADVQRLLNRIARNA